MTFATRILSAVAGLPKATHRARREPQEIPLSDGVVLKAYRFVPEGDERAPLVLVRCPYGREGAFGLGGWVYAERGFQMLLVSVRGTFGSGGRFEPFRHEREDGLEVLRWLRAQPWYPGSFAMSGPSYLGHVQWAIAAEAGDELKLMCPQATASEFRSVFFPGGAFALENALSWGDAVVHQEDSVWTRLPRQLSNRHLERAASHLPLDEADTLATGKRVDFIQDWLVHDRAGDPWWAPACFDDTLNRVKTPVHMTTGWFDLFLPWQLADYEKLKALGRAPHLRVGPWIHASPAGLAWQMRDGLAAAEHHLRGGRAIEGRPVKLFVQGAEVWREFDSWPPPATPVRFHLRAEKKLAKAAPGNDLPDGYRYDPANPTPSLGGAQLNSKTAGVKNNASLEARADVLTYTTDALSEDLEVIGTPQVELFVESSLQHTDFFVRLCDVHPNGKSLNVTDALQRVEGAPGVVRFSLWPTAHRFLRGHRLRVQVSSGAHPRYARNPGTGEPLATGTTLQAADVRVFHDSTRPSCVVLPRSDA